MNSGRRRRGASGLGGTSALVLAALACSGGSDSVVLGAQPATGDDTSLEPAGEPTESKPSPLYALGVRVQSAEARAGYIVTVPSLEAGTTWSLDRAVEVGQDAWLSGVEGEPLVLVSSSNEPTITRWAVQSDGSFTRDTVLSFANLGLDRTREARGSTAFYLKDKAYFLSSDGQLVVWDPREMVILGTIPWRYPAGISPEGVFSGDENRVLMTVSFYRDETPDWTVYEDNVHLVEIDPLTDTIVSETEEPRCNNLSTLSRAPSGTSYHSPYAPLTPLWAMLGEQHGPVNCSLRIVPPDAAFDSGYDVDLRALVGGRPAGGLFMLNEDIAFIRVWHEELAPALAADRSNFEDLMFSAAYQWWRWPVGSASAELVPDQEPTTGQWEPIDVGGHKLLPKVAADYTSTELAEILPDGRMQPMISGPGTLLGVLKVR